MRTINVNLYQYEELEPKAQEKAREWWRVNAFDYTWWDAVYEDANAIAKLLGIDLETVKVSPLGKPSRRDINIQFSGFWSQGDGACFEGTYRYNKHSVPLVKNYAPEDERLHFIATQLADVQRRNFYKVSATVKHRGHYSHETCTEIDVEGCRTDSDIEEVKGALRSFMRWIYRQLEQDYNYQTSDEVVAETLIANEYEFLFTGEPE